MKSTITVPAVVVAAFFLHLCCSSPAPIAEEIEKAVQEEGLDAAVARYHELKRESPERYDFGIDQLRNLAEKLYRSGKVHEAIRLAELNAEVFPDSAIVYYDLATAFHYSGDRAKSRQNITRSLELDPLSLSSVILKKKIWVNIANSFSAANEFDHEYFRAQTSAERLDEMQFLREQYLKMNKKAGDAHRKGLRRVIAVVKQA